MQTPQRSKISFLIHNPTNVLFRAVTSHSPPLITCNSSLETGRPQLSSLIGPIGLLLLGLLTLVLSLLPRYKLSAEPQISEIDKMFEFFRLSIPSTDWLYIWRSGLITYNLIAIAIVSIIIYSNYLSKKNIR